MWSDFRVLLRPFRDIKLKIAQKPIPKLEIFRVSHQTKYTSLSGKSKQSIYQEFRVRSN